MALIKNGWLVYGKAIGVLSLMKFGSRWQYMDSNEYYS
jgi:hypothetical protein